MLHGRADSEKHHARHLAALANSAADVIAVEKGKIKGAIRTDFVLSAEIIVITLGTMSDAPIAQQVLALSAVAVGATVFVYGLVAGIVKLDDLGLALERRGNAASQKIGAGILRTAPIMMKTLSFLGTAAMFTVGGGIMAHGVPMVEHFIEGLAEPMADRSSILGTLVTTVLDAVVGVVAGGIGVVLMTLVKRVRRKQPE